MQNQVNTHPPTPKKTREVGGIAFGPKEVKSLHPGVALCYAVHPPALSIEKEGGHSTPLYKYQERRGAEHPPLEVSRKRGCRAPPL